MGALDLRGNELSGEIPPELGSLSNLLVLDLNDNALSGEIPRSSPEMPSSLEDQLNLDFSELGGLPFC